MQKLIKLILTANATLFIAIGLTLTVLLLSLVRTDSLPTPKLNQIDKVYHVLAYFGLSMAWFLYALIAERAFEVKSFFLISLGLVLFGIIIEVLQLTLTEYRSFDWYDAIANSVGIFVAFLCFMMLKSKLMILKNN